MILGVSEQSPVLPLLPQEQAIQRNKAWRDGVCNVPLKYLTAVWFYSNLAFSHRRNDVWVPFFTLFYFSNCWKFTQKKKGGVPPESAHFSSFDLKQLVQLSFLKTIINFKKHTKIKPWNHQSMFKMNINWLIWPCLLLPITKNFQRLTFLLSCNHNLYLHFCSTSTLYSLIPC